VPPFVGTATASTFGRALKICVVCWQMPSKLPPRSPCEAAGGGRDGMGVGGTSPFEVKSDAFAGWSGVGGCGAVGASPHPPNWGATQEE
jgi:hypothetical protein